MEWIKSLLPLLGVFLGWGLAESGKIFTDKRQDKRKLKKLLFYLLELRFHFSKELSIEIDIQDFMDQFKLKFINKFGISDHVEESNLEFDLANPLIKELISKSKGKDNKIDFLTSNIDDILNDLSEILPILAYELSGQHNIKERLLKLDNYLDEIVENSTKMPFDMKDWIQPKLTTDLLKEIDESIEKIAQRIDKKTKREALKKIAKMDYKGDNDELDKIVDEYLTKIQESIISNSY
jgi:hypothetical protein